MHGENFRLVLSKSLMSLKGVKRASETVKPVLLGWPHSVGSAGSVDVELEICGCKCCRDATLIYRYDTCLAGEGSSSGFEQEHGSTEHCRAADQGSGSQERATLFFAGKRWHCKSTAKDPASSHIKIIFPWSHASLYSAGRGHVSIDDGF